MVLPAIGRWKGRVALVTGASSGMGKAISLALVHNGLVVVGCARRKDKLDTVALEANKNGYAGKFHAYQVDLREEAQVEAMFAWINKTLGGVDVLVNNAGFANPEPLLECTAKIMRDVLNTNVIAVVLCCKLAAASMASRGVTDGHIININAHIGHAVGHYLHFFSASKRAVDSITTGIRRELVERNSRTRVTAISPGHTKTDFLDVAYANRAKEIYAPGGSVPAQEVPAELFHAITPGFNKAEYLNQMLGEGGTFKNKTYHLVPKDIAEAVLQVLSFPERVQIFDLYIQGTGAL